MNKAKITKALSRAGFVVDREDEIRIVESLPEAMYEDSRIGNHSYTDYWWHKVSEPVQLDGFTVVVEDEHQCCGGTSSTYHVLLNDERIEKGDELPRCVIIALAQELTSSEVYEATWATVRLLGDQNTLFARHILWLVLTGQLDPAFSFVIPPSITRWDSNPTDMVGLTNGFYPGVKPREIENFVQLLNKLYTGYTVEFIPDEAARYGLPNTWEHNIPGKGKLRITKN